MAMTATHSNRVIDSMFATACLLAAAAAVAVYAQDRSGRTRVAQFVKQYTVAERRADAASTARLAIAPDMASNVVSDAALRDALEPVNLTNASPEMRQRWIDAASRVDDELSAARVLALDAIAARPGWPYHYNFLGRVVFTQLNRNLDPALISQPQRWAKPMKIGALGAPNAAGVWESLAFAYLSTWPQLGPKLDDSTTVFKRAFLEEYFVSRAFPIAVTLLGSDRVGGLIPDDAKPLRTAFEELSKAGAAAPAYDAYRRWEEAEMRERVRDLATIEKRASQIDVDSDEFRQLCESWAWSHSIWDFESTAARAQATRLLELWPARRGAWTADRRADIVRYLLTGEPRGAAAGALARTINVLDNVPGPVQAAVALAAGDIDTADRFAQSVEARGEDWSPVHLRLAADYVRRRAFDRAAAALSRLPPYERARCDSLLIERQLIAGAAKEGKTPDLSGIDAQIESRRAALSAMPAALSGDLRFCLAPQSLSSMARAYITVHAPTATVVAFGVDGVRHGAALVDGDRRIAIDTPLIGERSVFVRTLAAPVRITPAEKPEDADPVAGGTA